MPQDPATDSLLPDVYEELRRLADSYVRRERFQSVQATDLVHDCLLYTSPSPRD